MNRLLPLAFSLAVVGAGCSAVSRTPESSPTNDQPSITGSASTKLDLSNRELTAIPMDVFSRTDLVELDLSRNRLTNAPPSQIGALKKLRALNLSHNTLTGLPAELGQLQDLEILNVSNNGLTGLPMELGNLSSLRVLDIRENPFSARDLDEIAKKLPNTTILR